MTAPARLLGLRLHGFKSFGERTVVEFGPGISAIVGPNGSGKSNLADALRWALGEQGKALRLRRSEDVIFAGSEKRSALGMADVTLVFDNEDRLLPIDFETIEMGRRLFRSGENDYLLNKQRVRLKDLVDLLDAAHLADNAFLFIGQGMVDQALALRPEERRPLFEEVAGVRRHERRKARAEEQLFEAEANLARVEDVLAELRPQARRLAVQAEQQASRQTAGREYGRAVLVAARSRWQVADGRAREAARQLQSGRAEVETSLAALRESEERASTLARDLASRTEVEGERRAAYESARAVLTQLQLRAARAAGDAAAVVRDRARLVEERSAVEAHLERQRREMAAPVPAQDLLLSAAVSEAERALGEALEELGAMRAAGQAEGEALAALRRVEAARAAELETARRRLGEAQRVAAGEMAAAEEAARRMAEAEKAGAEPREALEAAVEAEEAAMAGREAARQELDRVEGRRQAAAEKASASSNRAAGLRGRFEALEARLAEEEARGIAKAARKAGGKALSEGLEVERGFRVAVEAALGEAMRGYVLAREGVAGLEGQRGTLVLEEGGAAVHGSTGRGRAAEAADAAVAAASGFGGGKLADAVRVDQNAVAVRLLEHTLWVPDLYAALEVQAHLPAGWMVVSRGGAVATAAGVVTLGRSESLLDRRAELSRLGEELARLDEEAAVAAAESDDAQRRAAAARAAFDAAREAESAAAATRRQAEDAERRAARVLEAAARESAWRSAQAARAQSERERLAAAVKEAEAAAAPRGAVPEEAAGAAPALAAGNATDRGATVARAATGSSAPASGPAGSARAMAEWESRVAALRARRDQLAQEEAVLEAARRDAEAGRARAGAAAEFDQTRLSELDRQTGELADRERALAAEREGFGEELAAAAARETLLRAELDEIRGAEAVARAHLAEAEAAAGRARGRLRACQERTRTAEVAELEARMALDSVREQALVELSGLGELGFRMLEDEGEFDSGVPAAAAPASSTPAAPAIPDAEDEEETAARLDAALAAAAARWVDAPVVEPPTPSRLASLRRRFHELGATNPFAAEEYEALKTRLDGLETQRADLLDAISKTRQLMGELNEMISTQFRETFHALETAFDSRFRQLFGGGFARLALTEPDDLSATGIEITARPPGKKAQPLSMLSGGERALTAVALLFAMLEVHPVPFCVLDEVDAALDEANIGRFAEALRNLADQTQCLVITHNRGTIEIADALYGVTVGDDAVSRVISLRLEEAREMADEAARNKPAANAG
jgi:chromosome segregation protein